jgi:hypothetical protein
MANICRVRTPISGGPGGAGVVTTFFHNNLFSVPTATELHNYLTDWAAFWTAVKAHVSNSTTYTFPGTQEVIDEASGGLQALSIDPSPPASVVGTNAAAYVGGVGVRCQWNTSNIRNRRLVKGWFFLTPIGATDMDTTGELKATTKTAIEGALSTLLAAWAGHAVVPTVYHRPASITSNDGQAFDVDSTTVRSVIASLYSRRV